MMKDSLDTPKEEDGETKELMDQLRDQEKKFRKLVEKRNELNDQARESREERDALNEQKKSLVAELRSLQGERDSKNADARVAKEKRNEFQRQAKALIEEKRKMRGTGSNPQAGGKIRDLEGELRRLERTQETSAMSIAKENELIKRIGEIRKELNAAKGTYTEEAKLLGEIKGVDGKIDALFKMADDAHKIVVELSNAAQAAHDRIGPILDQLKFLDAESDKKHQAYLALRADADKHHAEATTLRDEVEKLREKRQGVFRERRAIVGDQRRQVQEALFDDVKIEEKADDAVKALLSGGKITL